MDGLTEGFCDTPAALRVRARVVASGLHDPDRAVEALEYDLEILCVECFENRVVLTT